MTVTIGDKERQTHIFVGDVCLDQSSIQARLHIMQLFIVLEEQKRNDYSSNSNDFKCGVYIERFHSMW